MNRILVLVLTVALIAGSLALTVSADSEEPFYHDILSQGVVSTSNSIYSNYLGTNLSFTSYPVSIYYVDFIVSSPRDLTSVCSRISFYDYFDLTCVSLGNNLYRCFGVYEGSSVLAARTSFLVKYYTTNPAVINTITYKSFNVGFVPVNHFEDVTDVGFEYGIFNGSVGGRATVSMESPNTTYRVEFPSTEELEDGWYSYRVLAECNDWKKYDFVEFGFCARIGTVESISAKTTDGQILDCDVSYLLTNSSGDVVEIINNVPFNWPDTNPDRVYITVRVDLSSLNRDSSGDPQLYITGAYNSWTATGALPAYFEIRNYSGYIKTSYLSEEVGLQKRIKTLLESWNTKLPQWFTDLGDRFEAIMNPEVPSADQVIQDQETLNQDINDQVGLVVEEWNVQYAELGDNYDLAVTSSVPALSWLGSIAQGFFDNMGWFRSLYLFIGALSIYFLLLSKSGLVRKFSHSNPGNK